MNKMMTAGALLLACGSAGAAQAAPAPTVATFRPALAVVAGAKPMTRQEKDAVDGKGCVTTTTHYYVWVPVYVSQYYVGPFVPVEYARSVRTVCDADM